MNFWFNKKYCEKFMEQNFNVWFPKCMIQLYFPAPQFMTTFSLFLTMDRHFFFFWSLARTWMKSTLFTLWDVKNISLEVLPRPLPGVCWVEFWIPSLPSFPSTAPLRLCLEHFSQTQRVQDNLPYSTERSPIYWGTRDHQITASPVFLAG